jgi:hypothetical protein
VGTGQHVIAWRYAPDSQTLKVTVDGTTTSSSSMAPIGALPQMPFIIGASSPLPSDLFIGNLSELVVVGSSILDADVENFTEYARNKWDGLPTQGNADPCYDASGQPTTNRCDDANPSTYGDRCSSGICAGSVPIAGSPADFSPTAWYYAAPQDVDISDAAVATWFDRSAHHLDLAQGFAPVRPTLSADGWSAGKATVSFVGHNLLFRDAWTAAPDGNDAEFTILAVMQPTASQTTGVAAWWSLVGAGRVACDEKTNSSATVLDLFRTDPSNATQDFSGSTDLATAKHVLAWRYAPELIRLSVDGANVPSGALSALGAVSPEMMLLGADSGFASAFLNGQIAELSVIPRSLSDTEVASFGSYAQAEWGGVPGCYPSCVGKTCGASDGCSGICTCGPSCGTTSDCTLGLMCNNGICGDYCAANPGAPGCAGLGLGCNGDADCAAGLACGAGVAERFGGTSGTSACWGQQCTTDTDQLLCGSPAAPCGLCAPPPTVCTTSADCPAGDTCTSGNATSFGLGSGSVCWPTICTTAARSANCGSANAPCGTCDCTQQCSNKTCGGDMSDGCGGQCRNLCADRQSGCSSDANCATGSVCIFGGGPRVGLSAGANICLPAICATDDPSRVPCGSASSPCGSCPACTPQCDARCGGAPDGCGGTCSNSCGTGEACSADGICMPEIDATSISIPDGLGGTRTVTPLDPGATDDVSRSRTSLQRRHGT